MSAKIFKFVAVPVCLSFLFQCSVAGKNIQLSQGSSINNGTETSSLPPATTPTPGPTTPVASGDTKADPAAGDAEQNAKLDNFKLTSSFKNLQPMPPDMGEKSPALSWSGPPSGSGSYAIQMVDIDATPPLVLWTIVNIPLNSEGVPAGIASGNNLLEPKEAAGANQPNPYKGPQQEATPHRIEITLYAVLPNIGIRISADAAANKAELETKSVGKTILTGIFE